MFVIVYNLLLFFGGFPLLCLYNNTNFVPCQ
nr:MAG TPA: hypothetical protein [Caudoviricetes sp.]